MRATPRAGLPAVSQGSGRIGVLSLNGAFPLSPTTLKLESSQPRLAAPEEAPEAPRAADAPRVGAVEPAAQGVGARDAGADLEALDKELAEPKADAAAVLKEAFEGGAASKGAEGVAGRSSLLSRFLARRSAAVSARQTPAIQTPTIQAQARPSLVSRVNDLIALASDLMTGAYKPVFETHASPAGNEEKMLAQLARSLEENGLPPHKTAKVAGPADDRRPTVAILAPASRHKVPLAREGGRQAPGDVNLVLDASWLIQERYPDGRTKLLVKKGVVFDAHGQATVIEYATPRRVHYFANYFTLGSNDRDDGMPFEKNLDVPQSSSFALEREVNDKLATRLLLAARGIVVPATLALLMPAHPLAQAAEGRPTGSVAAVAMPQGGAREAQIERLLDAFLERTKVEEVVIKPSGPQFHSGRGVKFFRKEQRAEMLAHALALARDPKMTQDGAVLIDERLDSAPLDREGRKMETTLRVLAARAPWGGAETAAVFARVGPWGKPTTAEAADPRDNATVELWPRLLSEWKAAGLLDERSARELHERLWGMGAAALRALMDAEKSRVRRDGESYQGQTDMIGLDVMVARRDGKLVPVVIEVNDHDAGGQYNLDTMVPDQSGEHSRLWVATMLQRARRDALKGKRIVLVGAGYEGKKPIFERARELGVDVILLDHPGSWANDPRYVAEFIPIDSAKPAEALALAREKLRRSARKNGKIDGIRSFWEDDIVLTADLAAELGLAYHSPQAARSARSKFETQEVLARAGVPAARRTIVKNLSTVADVRSREALVASFRQAAAKVGFPAVLKPVSGAAAIGTEKVSSLEEAVAAYRRISALINSDTDPIFALNSDLLLMQYLDGPEYDVDIVMSAGRATYVSVTDNKPTREPSFLATGSRLPSTLTAEQQAQARTQAVDSAAALGLTDGVIHLEGKYTSEGPRLIEANARMGGAYVRDWNQHVWGVDLVEEDLMSAAGIPGRPFKPARPIIHLDGDFINSDKPGVIKVLELPEEARKLPGFVRFRMVKQVGDRITTDEGGGYVRVAMLEVGGQDAAEARRNLDAIKAKVRFVVE